MGRTIDRWFCPVIEGVRPTPIQYRFTHHYVVRVGRLLGVAVPDPEPLPLNDTVRVARWAAQACREHGGAAISSSASMAVRIATAAREAGIDLAGVVMTSGGEPLTQAKAAAIAASGARAIPSYHMSEVGAIGRGCPRRLRSQRSALPSRSPGADPGAAQRRLLRGAGLPPHHAAADREAHPAQRRDRRLRDRRARARAAVRSRPTASTACCATSAASASSPPKA